MTATTCPDSGLLAAEGAFTTGLSESANYLLTPNALELYTAGGDTVRFEPI